MEKKNIAGYFAGLTSMGVGAFIGVRGMVPLLVGLEEISKSGAIINALPVLGEAIPSLGIAAGGAFLVGIGAKSIINTYKGNRRTKILNDVKEIKKDVNKLREDLSKGIDKTPMPTQENVKKKEIDENVR